MEITKHYKKKWISLKRKNHLELEELIPLDDYNSLRTFQHFLPKKRELSPEQNLLRTKLLQQESYSFNDIEQIHEFNAIKGYNFKSYKEIILDPLYEQMEVSSKLGIKLPVSYVKLFGNIKLFNRIRSYPEYFAPNEEILPFDQDRKYFFVKFGMPHIGKDYWYYLLMDKYKNHLVLYSSFDLISPFTIECFDVYSNFELYICSYSFDEFIKRVSIDLKLRN